MKEFWNDRYEKVKSAYGKDPSSFFREKLWDQNFGRILLPGEGEGRNAIYAAKKGWLVHAFDYSKVAAAKAIEWSRMEALKIEYEICDVESFETAPNYYHAVGIAFLHLPEVLRLQFHEKMIECLKPGGTLIAEYFTKQQLGKNSGGPQNPEMLYSEEELKEDFRDMEIKYIGESLINLDHSVFHKGDGWVVRILAVKPELSGNSPAKSC